MFTVERKMFGALENSQRYEHFQGSFGKLSVWEMEPNVDDAQVEVSTHNPLIFLYPPEPIISSENF